MVSISRPGVAATLGRTSLSWPPPSLWTVHRLTETPSLLTFPAQGPSGGGCCWQQTGHGEGRDGLAAGLWSWNQSGKEQLSSRPRVCVWIAQLCLTLCDPMDCSPPGPSVQGISQARILEWIAILSSGDFPYPGIQPASDESSALASEFFTTRATWEALATCTLNLMILYYWQ